MAETVLPLAVSEPAPAPTASPPADWKASVSAKEFLWFVGKAIAGIQAAPLALPWLHSIGVTIEPNSIAYGLLPAILGGLLHAGQDVAALKTGIKWL